MLRWPYTFATVLSLAVGATAIACSQWLEIPLRDPDGFLGPAYIRLPLIVLLFFMAGIVPTAIHREGWRHIPSTVGRIIRYEWTWRRLAYISAGLLSFYACYVSYRNIKSYLPVIRDGVLFDTQLLRFDHWLMFGNNPAEVLHTLLGTNVSAQVLATVYVSYLMVVPLTLGAYLVWTKDLSLGAWYATALSLNWVLGAASYYMLPTLGPAFAQPQMFQDLSDTGVTALQRSLFRAGAGFKEDPTGSYIYGIAGFASLHVSVVFTACLFFERTGQRRYVRVLAWIYFALTVIATLYFGWHYIVDDVAGVLIGWIAVSLGAWATGNRGRRRRRKAAERSKATLDPIASETVRAELDEAQPAVAESIVADESAGGSGTVSNPT